MSVYIHGFEMPKIPVLFCVHPDGKVFADLEGDWREYRAVPVPEHGRLIDADVICEECRRVAGEYDGIYPDCAYCPVHLATAIIPADPAKEVEG